MLVQQNADRQTVEQHRLKAESAGGGAASAPSPRGDALPQGLAPRPAGNAMAGALAATVSAAAAIAVGAESWFGGSAA